ncbi:hypothetical protein [Streptomyces sp. NPDC056190]|uniref:hypothetical protein n=1 Tax=Streptomyces sp. NPDC056190 TaxID=3345741 RepID=UPI0035D86C07
MLFTPLLAAAMVLIRLGIPESAEAVTFQGSTGSARRGPVRAALALVPFATMFRTVAAADAVLAVAHSPGASDGPAARDFGRRFACTLTAGGRRARPGIAQAA